MKDYRLSKGITKKGNPMAIMRWRWQTYTKDTNEPMESNWVQFRNVAIRQAAECLIEAYNDSGVDDMTVKIFNEMNYKAKKTTITLSDAYRISGKEFQQ